MLKPCKILLTARPRWYQPSCLGVKCLLIFNFLKSFFVFVFIGSRRLLGTFGNALGLGVEALHGDPAGGRALLPVDGAHLALALDRLRERVLPSRRKELGRGEQGQA